MELGFKEVGSLPFRCRHHHDAAIFRLQEHRSGTAKSGRPSPLSQVQPVAARPLPSLPWCRYAGRWNVRYQKLLTRQGVQRIVMHPIAARESEIEDHRRSIRTDATHAWDAA